MNDMHEVNLEPFAGGPYARALIALGLPPPPAPRVVGRIVAVVLLAWIPLVALAALQGNADKGETSYSVLRDAAIYARYLLAVPLLLIAESFCLPVLARIVRHFEERGLIADEDRERYAHILASTRRMLNSRTAEITLILLIVAQSWLAARAVTTGLITDSWRVLSVDGATVLTYAGWWNAAVSYPLYLFVLYSWLWRLFLWGRCLFLLSRLNLRLQPSHPDRVGGLGFLNAALSVLPLLAFALACIPAGGLADQVLFAGKEVTDFRAVILAFAVIIVGLLAGPLLFFSQSLRRARMAGIFRYGVLASIAARREEDEEQGAESDDAETNAEAADFSTVAERFTNAREMKLALFDVKSLASLIVGVCLPFVPVLMIQIPLADILEKLKGLIL